MNKTMPSEATWPVTAMPLHEIVEQNAHKIKRMPVFLVAFTLIWLGVLDYIDYIRLGNADALGPLISLDCAAVFFLCGAAMMTARSRVNISRALALVSLLISAYNLPGSLAWTLPLGLHAAPGTPLQFPGSWALLSCALSAALVCCTLGMTARRAARYLGIVTIAGAVLFRLAPAWFPALSHGSADIANIGAFLQILGGCAVVALSRRWRHDSAFAHRTIAIIGILGTLLSVLSWYALTEYSRHRTEDSVQATSAGVALLVRKSVDDQLALFDRMGKRWNALGEVPPARFIDQELNSYVNDIAALSLVAVLDESGSVRMVQSKDAASRRWLEQRLGDADYRRWLDRVHDSRQVRLGPVASLSPGQFVAPIAVPLSASDMQGWTLISVENINALLTEAIGTARGPLHFRIEQNGHPVYDGTRPGDTVSPSGATAISLPQGETWALTAWHGGSRAAPLSGLFADIVLLVGLAFTLFLIRTQRLASGMRYRSMQLQHGALHDPLTGLPNKQYLESELTRICQMGKAKGMAVWVILFDLDGMKFINDSMGHSCGDRILMEVAQRMHGEMGGKGFLARMGGDEFVIVFAGLVREEVLGITSRIIAAVARPYDMENTQLQLSASAGITVAASHHSDPMELVREADLAMTRAMRGGHNSWSEYTADLSALVAERLSLRIELQKSLDEDGFELHYQPLIDGNSGRIVGVEALLRWPHPVRGNISPSTFIPIAEETGQIISLSDWVLNTACQHIKTLKTLNLADFPVMVNISPLHFQRADFIDSLRKKLQIYSLPAQSLEIEITEGVLLDNSAHTITKLRELKELGVAISIDDFGTGYSSLNYLKNLPIDKIKIDRSFVNEVISDRHDAAIAKAIIDIAHHLNLKVIAEGVETESQYWFLKRNFCDEFQGFLFARPMSFIEFEQKLKENGGIETLPGSKYDRESDRTLLLLDDEENILRALARVLRRDGYRILTAKTPPEAFSLLATHNVQVIVSDQRMPEMTGTEFFRSVKGMYPATVRLILSGYTDLKSVTEAINRGAIYKFLTKPWDEEELRSEIAHAFKGFAAQDS